ncbi:hypothetical protein J2W97_000637 [Paenibacillus jamilae]|jgi:hypothetical protein|uniref:hypothetical protein n=1 Tax=Paenibacillus TaxID=44249 RepID=UPI00037CC5C7|nr:MULTISPECIES: hypothetical protein [Paenibacillus]MDP9674654.1 hypothetical protein [Paenibacillus jamilae]AHM66783.1 hypothetical protein PPSQR21_031420 [Paenibacillus polymyxa SQR-21]AIY07686.1 hypothetical protein LK13_03395 [Paenibacillus polymyxa]AUS27455.1 hypothetical protein C1A50_3289 [Paenibacillus polymyxa]KAE8558409.1 hypothetical protein BJH92_20075 [Paenibacillus polymyxa]
MTTYYVTGTKQFTSELQTKLMELSNNELKTPHPYTQELELLMFAITRSSTPGKKDLDSRFGEYYQFILLNEHAKNLLIDYKVPFEILGTVEYEDPINEGFSLLIRNTRFV